MKIYNELESLGFFKWLKEKGFGSGFTPIILDAQPIDSIERSGYNAIAFRWFREKYNLKGYVEPVEYLDGTPDTYHWSIFNNCNSGNDQLTHEEAELECLKKLIQIIENK
jgi:hypothetical protein